MMRKKWAIGIERRDLKADTLAGLIKRFKAAFKADYATYDSQTRSRMPVLMLTEYQNHRTRTVDM